MKTEIIENINRDEITAYVCEHKDALLYHSPKYLNFISTICAASQCHIICRNQENKICGLLPLMKTSGSAGDIYNSSPFFGSHGGILANSKIAFLKILEKYKQFLDVNSNFASSTIISHFYRTDEYPFDFTDQRISQITPLTSISNEYDLFQIIDSSAKRNIKKAERAGFSIEHGANYVEQLREIHLENMKYIGGRTKPDNFFGLLKKSFEYNKDYRIYVAMRNHEVCSALLIFFYNHIVEYFIPGTNPTYRSEQPLALILKTAMLDSAQMGHKSWNWGGTWSSQAGVYQFKKKWGAEDGSYKYFTKLGNIKIKKLSQDTLQQEYGYFYTLPFSELRENK